MFPVTIVTSWPKMKIMIDEKAELVLYKESKAKWTYLILKSIRLIIFNLVSFRMRLMQVCAGACAGVLWTGDEFYVSLNVANSLAAEQVVTYEEGITSRIW